MAQLPQARSAPMLKMAPTGRRRSFFLIVGWVETPAAPDKAAGTIVGTGYFQPPIGIFEDEGPTYPKSIRIGGLPPDKYFLNTIVDRAPLVWSDGDELRRSGNVGQWPNNGSLPRRFSLAKNWLVRVTDSDICPTFEVVTWCSPEIFQGYMCHDGSVIINQSYHSVMNKHIGPQLPFGGLFRAPYKLSSSQPQKEGNSSQDNCKNCDNAVSIYPFQATTPRKRAPFLPVFGLGALTFIVSMFLGIYIDNWGQRLAVKPKRKWHGHLLKIVAAPLIISVGCFSFVFGFPWAAFF